MRPPSAVPVVLSLLLTLSLAAGAAAQDVEPPAAERPPAAGSAAENPPAGEAVAPEPAAAPAFDPQAATEAYLARLSPEERARSDAYFEGGYWIQLWRFLYGLGIAWLLLGSGLSARLRDLAERIGRRRPVATGFYAAGYIVLTSLLTFPLTLYVGFFREHRYGLATQGFGGWFRDWVLWLAVGVVLFALLLVALYGLIRRVPRTWWLWGTGVGALFMAFVLLVAPVYIEPMFNTYRPLEDAEIREPILSMARANGVPAEEVWEFDASRQTTRISANVGGLFGTMRVRLNDNLLRRTSRPEILAVMGHELGHYVLNHLYEMLIVFSLFLAGGLAFVALTFDRVQIRWGSRWGVRGIGDVAGLPLLAALISIYFFVLTPIVNTTIRVNEAEADAFGLAAAREPDGFAEVALKLAEYRKLDPGPVEEWIFYDHPSGRARIQMAMEWKAENLDAEGGAGR